MIKKFFKYVEIQTKVASVSPFLIGLVYVIYKFNKINIENTIIFFLAMLLFDCTTTAINNYIDYRKEGNPLPFKRGTAFFIILVMLITSGVLGIILTIKTSWVILIAGVICFFIGVVYTFGPIPISRTPYGEIFSGVTMGFFIPFITVYINSPIDYFISYDISDFNINVNLNIVEMLKLAILTIPSILTISNIMLANNICDVKKDILLKRYTLPYYIGTESSLKLFNYIYLTSYLTICILILFKIIPITTILCLLTIFLVNKNVKLFFNEQVKEKTFILSVKNFLIINFSLAISMSLGIFSFL